MPLSYCLHEFIVTRTNKYKLNKTKQTDFRLNKQNHFLYDEPCSPDLPGGKDRDGTVCTGIPVGWPRLPKMYLIHQYLLMVQIPESSPYQDHCRECLFKVLLRQLGSWLKY